MNEIITSHEIRDLLKNSPDEIKRKTIELKENIMLNEFLGGLRTGEIEIIASYPGKGKTSYLIHLTRDLSKSVNCMWFSADTEQEQFVDMLGEDVPLFYLPKTIPNLFTDDRGKKTFGNADSRLFFIASMVKEAKEKHNIKVVMLDNLQYFTDAGGSDIRNTTDRVMLYLKEMAMKFDICLFLISHIKVSNYDTRPDETSLRGSGMIAGQSNSVMIINRLKEKDTDEMGEHPMSSKSVVYIDKNRRRPHIGWIKMEFDFHTKKFTELASSMDKYKINNS